MMGGAEPQTETPRSGGRGRRIAIVGAGAVGVTTAYDLARAGAEVTVYERGVVADGATGRAAGVCYDAFPTRPDATLGPTAIKRFQAFAAEGAPFRPCPYVWLAHEGDEERVRLVREGIERMQEPGRDVVELDAAALGERFPALRTDDVAVAGVTTGAGFADTGAYTAWLADRARSEGVVIREEIPVELSPDPPGVVPQAGADAGTLRETDAVVVAAGAHSKRLLADAGVSIPMKPYRVQALVCRVHPATERGVRSTERENTGRWGPMWYDVSADCYARPHPAGLLAGDGTEPVEADPERYDRDANEGFADSLAARVTHRLPGTTFDEQRAWAGLCTATPDRDPLVGELGDDVYVATGFQGQGFMRSPAIGQRLAGEILGADGLPAFDPNRFDGDESFEVREGMAVEG